VLRACVHCGFCNATCPTYQLLGDELDGPRGRIYQIKQLLEGAAATTSTQLHLDRCLTCRNCETTCPSGVEYGRLLDIGRAVVAAQVRRPAQQRLLHWLLREGLSRRRVFGAAYAAGRALRWTLPRSLRSKLAAPRAAGPWPQRQHTRKVALFEGCAQPAMAPSIDAASARVLDAVGVQARRVGAAGCCGAIRHHLDDQPGALANARHNIDAWWPLLQSGQIEAIVVNASGCALMVREYGRLLRGDRAYAAKAERVSQVTRDLGEFLQPELPSLQARAPAERIADRPAEAVHAAARAEDPRPGRIAVERAGGAAAGHGRGAPVLRFGRHLLVAATEAVAAAARSQARAPAARRAGADSELQYRLPVASGHRHPRAGVALDRMG
jgi:glycolate oxidase iron-sulfur subunit